MEKADCKVTLKVGSQCFLMTDIYLLEVAASSSFQRSEQDDLKEATRMKVTSMNKSVTK